MESRIGDESLTARERDDSLKTLLQYDLLTREIARLDDH